MGVGLPDLRDDSWPIAFPCSQRASEEGRSGEEGAGRGRGVQRQVFRRHQSHLQDGEATHIHTHTKNEVSMLVKIQDDTVEYN